MEKNIIYRTDEDLIKDIRDMATNKNVSANCVLDAVLLTLNCLDSLEENDDLFSLKNELRKFLNYDSVFLNIRGLGDESKYKEN